MEEAETDEYVQRVDRDGVAAEVVFAAMTSGRSARNSELAVFLELVQQEEFVRRTIVGDRDRQVLTLHSLESTHRFSAATRADRGCGEDSVARIVEERVKQRNEKGEELAVEEGNYLYDEELYAQQQEFLDRQYEANPHPPRTHYVVPVQRQQLHSPVRQHHQTAAGSDASPRSHVGLIDMAYVTLTKKHASAATALAKPGPPAAMKKTTTTFSGPPLNETTFRTLTFAESASRGAVELDWMAELETVHSLFMQDQWLVYDWSLSGPTMQAGKYHPTNDVKFRHLPLSMRPVPRHAAGAPSRVSPPRSRPPTSGPSSASSPRGGRPTSAAVLVANLKSAVPATFVQRVTAGR